LERLEEALMYQLTDFLLLSHKELLNILSHLSRREFEVVPAGLVRVVVQREEATVPYIELAKTKRFLSASARNAKGL
jgi:hypothetical protein